MLFPLLALPLAVPAQDASQVQAQIESKIESGTAAQKQAATNGQNPPEPSLKQNPLDALRNFEASPTDEYRLGKGDEITLDFTGLSEMQAKLVVGPDGRVSLPVCGEVMVSGLTRPEAAKAVESALAPYYTNIAVEITVTKYTANRVLLLGAVDHPGSLLFDGTPTLLEAITRGGVETGVNKITQVPERCAIYRGSDQVIWVELRTLLESGNPLVGIRLQRDDVIYVPSQSERIVSVLGDVQHPGAIELTHNSTLASIIAEAGGFNDKAGTKPHIQVVDPSTGKSQLLSFNDLLDPTKGLEVTLKPGEIIYVPRSGFNRATYVLERINPALSVASMALYTGVL